MFLNVSECFWMLLRFLRFLRIPMSPWGFWGLPCLLEAAWGCSASLRLLKPLALYYSFRAPGLYSTCLYFPSHGLIRLVASWWLLIVLHVLTFPDVLSFVQFTYIYVVSGHLCMFLKMTWCSLLSLEAFWLCLGPLALPPLSNFMNLVQCTCASEELLK